MRMAAATTSRNKATYMADHNEIGQWGEDIAALYLQDKGYRIVERDWRYGHRDIDIIALDGDNIVFVEVRTRQSAAIMPPEQTVNAKKQRMLNVAANRYVRMHRLNLPLRFDIVAITGSPDDDISINHMENAFIPEPAHSWRRH